MYKANILTLKADQKSQNKAVKKNTLKDSSKQFWPRDTDKE